ncbi:MAG: hypothetical protein IJ390_05715 [Lachnospiraceae bacterium]|nr:hypothetical protein [Lachnospiraceae bacterium]
MNIINKIKEKAANNAGTGNVTIAFLGDSVTQGCFELYKKQDGNIETYFDKESAYHRNLDRMLSVIYPSVPVNIINAGVSGGNAPHGLERIERDVLRFCPDLTVVCFGLNDAGAGAEGLARYTGALEGIFDRLKRAGSEIIFMTPNMMNTYVSMELTDSVMRTVAEHAQVTQNEGKLELYLTEAKKICEARGIKVCDCYAKWKKLAQSGVDTTKLLANRINHPVREMNWLFAVSLLETMFE